MDERGTNGRHPNAGENVERPDAPPDDQLDQARLDCEMALTRYQKLFELAPVAYLILNELGEIEAANETASQLFRSERDQLVGRPLSQWLWSDDIADWKVHCRDAFGRRVHTTHHFRLDRGRDEPTTALFRTVPTDDPEGPRLLTAIVPLVATSDRTWAPDAGTPVRGVPRVSREEAAPPEILADGREEIEAIGTLAVGIAHEFNNLLMGIRGVVDLAARKLPEGHSVRSHLDEIRTVATAGAAITQQLQSIANRSDVSPSTVEVDARLTGMRGLLRTVLGEDVGLQLDLGAPESRVKVDPVEFERTLMHMAVQGRNSMPSGGKLTITTRSFPELPPNVPGEIDSTSVLRIRVESTGSLTDGTRKAIAGIASLAESLDGTCVTAQLDKSVVLDLWLPADAEGSARRPEPARTTTDEHPATILVVEDDRLVRRTLRQYLESGRHRVVEAATAKEALELADRMGDKLDLLVTDSVLEDGYGLDVATSVMERIPSIGVLFVSAHGFAQLLRDQRVPEHARFLQKPFDREELLDDVADAIMAAQAEP